ncbi:MAG: C58 family peptidase [Gammaproteobacteria bacterium]|nr:C58 family peptidase [Gammaproteobacteria bacterium]
MKEVFSCGDINTDGICRSICARWLYTGTKKGGSVTDIDELGTKEFIKLLWDAADSDESIDKNNLLKQVSIDETEAAKAFSPNWMATQLTKGGGKAILTAWDDSLKKNGINDIRKVMEGHSMATNKVEGKLQFLDPNTSCWEFNNSLEFYEFLPQYLLNGTGGPAGFTGYKKLLRWQGIVYKYS